MSNWTTTQLEHSADRLNQNDRDLLRQMDPFIVRLIDRIEDLEYDIAEMQTAWQECAGCEFRPEWKAKDKN